MALPNPYWRDERRDLTVYHGDCRELLPEFADGQFGSVITDPPYNVGKDYGQGAEADRRSNYAALCAEWFAECRRIARTVSVTCGRDNLHLWLDIAEPDALLCWHKPACMARSSKFGFAHWEPILVWGPVCGKCTTDVVRAPIRPSPGLSAHPCPKPTQWASGQLVRLCANGDIVCDPFLGSGTTLAACAKLGLPGVGIEIEERYCEMAAARLSDDVRYGEVNLFNREATDHEPDA